MSVLLLGPHPKMIVCKHTVRKPETTEMPNKRDSTPSKAFCRNVKMWSRGKLSKDK